MKKAIVFAGGGSKGAYQIGVWKALNELGECFDIATGTSIGAVNAAFYVQHDFDAAEEMWSNLNVSNVMVNGINFEKSFESIFGQREQLIPFIKTYVNRKGADVTPFLDNLKHYFDADKFFGSDVDYGLVTVKYPSFEPREVLKTRGNGWLRRLRRFPCFLHTKLTDRNMLTAVTLITFPLRRHLSSERSVLR